jgi:hypothetical protein
MVDWLLDNLWIDPNGLLRRTPGADLSVAVAFRAESRFARDVWLRPTFLEAWARRGVPFAFASVDDRRSRTRSALPAQISSRIVENLTSGANADVAMTCSEHTVSGACALCHPSAASPSPDFAL